MPEKPHCAECHNEISRSASICPHCGRPGLYPNVRAAEDPEEIAALEDRYRAAIVEASGRGAGDGLREFEAVVGESKAVLARSANELQRLATSDKQIYATYYALLHAGVLAYEDDRWSLLRALADTAMFPGYKENIRFAALTLTEEGLANYGKCFIILRTEMIAHRASAFEENSTLFMEHHDIRLSRADDLPRGYRATWPERSKLAVAKLSRRVDAGTGADEYSSLLLRSGATTGDDEFIEVHVWGPMTARTFEQVTVKTPTKRAERAILSALHEKLGKVSVKLQVS